jgi:hypothetical protein
MNLNNVYVPLLRIASPSHQITTYLPVAEVTKPSNFGP